MCAYYMGFRNIGSVSSFTLVHICDQLLKAQRQSVSGNRCRCMLALYLSKRLTYYL